MAAGKTCNSCKWWKPADQFYRSAKAFDGLFGSCKACSDRPRPEAVSAFLKSRQVRERLIRERRMPMLRQALTKLQSREASR